MVWIAWAAGGGMLTDVAIGILPIRSRSDIGRRDSYCRVPSVVTDVETDVNGAGDTDPSVPGNLRNLCKT